MRNAIDVEDRLGRIEDWVGRRSLLALAMASGALALVMLDLVALAQ